PLPSCGNKDINAFIENTKPKESKKEYCDYFIEWIPYSHIKLINNDPIAKGNYSKVFIGEWKPLEQGDEVVDDKELINIDIALKVLKESNNLGSVFLNEFKIHYKFLGVCAIPFYGLTMHPEMNEYAMVMKRAIHGDLRKFIDRKFIDKSELSWLERVKILSSIAKSLNELHNSDILHRDLHCGNILVDDVDNDTKIFISDFGFSRTIDSQSTDTNEDDSWYKFEFPKGDCFYIKTTTSPSGYSSASSIQNYVVDVDRGFFMSWGVVKEGSKVIIAQQKSTTEHDGYQLWHYDDGFLMNKQTTLYLEPES
ncbi:30796_t:CDS:2, partial [Gigaspora margarita]